MVQLPKKISPCPIVDASFGINFETKRLPDTIFGVLYEKLSEKYLKHQRLPLASMPPEIINEDPRLKYQPHHKISNEDFSILIGPNTFSISHNSDYNGWDFFISEINDCISILKKSSLVYEIKRLGLRYIDLFENIDIFDVLKEKVELRSNSTQLRTKITSDDFYHILQITNDSKFLDKNGQEKQGSLLDIDTTLMIYRPNEFDYVEKFLEKAHQKEKELFYSLLKDDFIQTLNPEY